MSDESFTHDVFLSHSSKDKDVVRAVAERLLEDGLRVWLDDWEIGVGDSIPAKIEEGLEHSRVLVLCMSAQAFGSDWPQLESHTFRFKDPLNKERRFIPLRLDDAPIKGSLAQFLYIKWRSEERDQEYLKLLEACRPPVKPEVSEAKAALRQTAEETIRLRAGGKIVAYAFSADGSRALTADGARVGLWDVVTQRCLRVLEGHKGAVESVAWSADQHRVLSGSRDQTIRLWNVETSGCLKVLEGHGGDIWALAWSADQSRALSGSFDTTMRLWDVKTGRCLRVFEGHTLAIGSVAWSPTNQRLSLSGSADKTIRLWDVETGRCLRVLEGHTGDVRIVAWSPDARHALSGGWDNTVRLWNVDTGRCLRVFKGHTSHVNSVSWSADQDRALSCADDTTVRLWDVTSGRCLRRLVPHKARIVSVAWSADRHHVFPVTNTVTSGYGTYQRSSSAREHRKPSYLLCLPPRSTSNTPTPKSSSSARLAWERQGFPSG